MPMTSPDRQPRREPLRELPWRSSAAIVLLALFGGGALAVWLLWTLANGLVAGSTAQEAATLRLDAVKTGLTVAAALGAAVTLLLALRRQSLSERAQRFTEEDAERRQELSERVQRHAEADAEQRRITDLYVRAVDQIGSDKPPVRHGGLYALERLGDNSPQLRPTIIEVLCAYLRMPIADEAEDPSVAEEMQVRRTAQRIILRHCLPSHHRYWGGEGTKVHLNLIGARLADFRLDGAWLGWVNFTEAIFMGRTSFHQVTFTAKADFEGATFHRVSFAGSTFDGRSEFAGARFGEQPDFTGATFAGDVSFRDAVFSGGADLELARFHSAPDLPPGWTLSQPDGEGWFLAVRQDD
jgi:hypothetical protein